MIYVDTSVVLAHLLAEDRSPPVRLWSQTLVSSRLLEYETWVRIHGYGLGSTHGDAVSDFLRRFAFVELSPVILARAIEPFPTNVRTLDALHLSSVLYLRGLRHDVELATYDSRLEEAARGPGLPVAAL